MELILSEKDNARTLEVPAGGLVTVSLSENPTTGYRWESEDIRGLELVSDRFQSTGGMVGAAGTRVFQFRCISVGEHKLHLKNWREWEGDRSVINRFSATILVK